MAGIKDYSTTQANNTDLNGINTAEGMLPSNLNNAIRALMKNTREWYNDSQWVEYGDGDAAFTAAYASANSFTIAGVNVTAIYHAGRRIKLIASTPGTIYGTISSSTFSTNTTVNVTWDSGSLSSEAITNVYIGALSKTNSSIPTEIIGTANIADDAVTTAKIADSQITVAKMTTNSVDSDQYVDGSIDTVHIASAQVTADKIGTNAVTTAKINADAITSAKIGDEQIDSEHYVDGSIDTVHIADSQITVAKMAANSVDSDQYVDGSIDTAHIADSQITSAKIVDGTIVNADVNASAAIDATKIADGTVTSSEFQYINTLSSNAQTQIDAKAATTYVDNAVAGLRTRIIAECASTANVVISSALEAGDVIDGVTLVAGDRVLLKNQSTATENGLYIAVASGAGAASRDPEHDTIAELSGGMVVVNQGTANDNKIFLCTTDTDATLGSTSITYTTITPQNVGTVTSITAGTGLSGGAITASGTIAIDSTVATLAGTQTLTNKTLTAPKINEDVAVTSTATELNLLDGATVVIPGKVAGTNFTDSLLVGHATTGTLNAAARNTGIGIGAMDAITSGDDNTVIGRNAGSSITSGYSNTYIGQAAGNSSTTSRQNVAVGSSSLLSVTTGGHENTAVGLEALKSVNSGDHNVGIGWKAGDSLTSGKGNVLIGSNVEAASNTGDRQLTIGGYDGTNTTTWITGDSSGNLITPGTITANGVVLAAGGTDWQSITTGTTLTTVAGRGYPINTTSNGCTVTLPSSASVGDSISIVDYAGTFATNNIILTSSLKINGATNDKSLKTNREGVTVTYVDATQGWVATSGVNSGDQALDTVLVDFLVIAGGGSGGYSNGASGGAGGYRNSYSTETSGGGGSSEAGLTFNTGTSYTITVGAGGASKTSDGGGNSGTNSSISGTGITTITSIGGGAGGNVPTTAGLSGGSGGGAGTSAGSGTANQGFNGGAVPNGGGGGAGEAGNTDGSKHGGDGLASSITGSSITRGGGGGDPGGDGGGGDASTAGTANTGGGGGWFNGAGGGSGAGGSGVVILRMPTSLYSGTTSGSPTVSTSGIYTILIYNASGSYTA